VDEGRVEVEAGYGGQDEAGGDLGAERLSGSAWFRRGLTQSVRVAVHMGNKTLHQQLYISLPSISMLSFRIYTVATCILSTRMTFYHIIHNITHGEDLADIPRPTMPMNFTVLGSRCSTQSPIRNPLLDSLISSYWKYQASFRLLVLIP
jgi:hypothetical protein